MYSDDQQKPRSIYNWGPETQPQARSMVHGQGTPLAMALTSNPVSWLIPCYGQMLPFLDMKTGNADNPINEDIKRELSGMDCAPGSVFDRGGCY